MVQLFYLDRLTYVPQCHAALVRDFNAVFIAAMTFYDACIVVAISYRLSGNSSIAHPNFRARLKGSLTGEGLHMLSKRILHSGQISFA